MNHAEIEVRAATEQGRAALATARGALARALAEIDGYIKQFEEKEYAEEKADVLNWTINYIASNIINNTRLDMLAHAQARLLIAAMEQEST